MAEQQDGGALAERKKKDFVFETLTRAERILLLKAYDYNVDAEDYVLKPNGEKILSEEIPNKFLKVEEIALTPGSLNVIEGSPTSISKFIRESMVD